jgi:uncharacterized protein (TIGR03086 family)
MSPSDRYRVLSTRFTELVQVVPVERWASPSPCTDWVAADVVEHVITTERDLLAGMPFAPTTDVTNEATPINPTADRLGAWQQVNNNMQRALEKHASHAYDGYFGPTTFGETVDRFYNMDLVVHTWDVARAAGLPEFETIDPAEISRIRAAMDGLGDNLRQPGLFGPEIEVATDADAQTKFLAFLGRRN